MNASNPKATPMKKLVLAGVAVLALASSRAFAADVPVKAAPMVAPVPVFSWTGCYLGIEGGGAWGHSQHIGAADDKFNEEGTLETQFSGVPISDSFRVSGGLVGGTVGCNFQVGKVVVGAEGDGSWVSKKGSGPESDVAPFIGTAGWIDSTKERWLATFRGRAGWTFSPQWLVFVTGGFAVAGMEATVNDVPEGLIFTDRKTQFGWTVGGGIEWAFLTNFSLKVEYLYVRLEDAVFFENACGGSGATLGACGAPPPAPGPRFVPLDDHIVRAGLNFHFWTPVPPAPAVAVKAKY
jgi:outer membrane immunogenic protein